MFAIGSRQAWELTQRQLKELGFSFDKVDRKHQVVLTEWRATTAKGLEWLPAPRLPEQYRPDHVRFQVFVSPFAEPARVYVGSILGARKVGLPPGPGIAYNVKNLNQALMVEISKALGQDGLPIPADREERRRLALSLLENGAKGCLEQTSPPQGAKIKPPRKVPLSEFEVIYPPAAKDERVEGRVQVELTIREDGSVASPRLTSRALGHQLEASALGAASLLLYTPTKLGDCPVPTIMTYTLRYRLHR